MRVTRRDLEDQARTGSLLRQVGTTVDRPYGLQDGAFCVVFLFVGGELQSGSQRMGILCANLFGSTIGLVLSVLPSHVAYEFSHRATLGAYVTARLDLLGGIYVPLDGVLVREYSNLCWFLFFYRSGSPFSYSLLRVTNYRTTATVQGPSDSLFYPVGHALRLRSHFASGGVDRPGPSRKAR